MNTPTPKSFLRSCICTLSIACAVIFTPLALAQDEAVEPAPAQSQSTPAYAVMPMLDAQGDWTSLGSLDGDGIHIEFSRAGAGIESLKLAGEYEDTDKKDLVTPQSRVSINGVSAVPFAALAIEINGQTIALARSDIWREKSPGVFEAFVIDAAKESSAVRIERRFALDPSSVYGFTLTQTVENLSGGELTTRLTSTGAIDLPKAKSTYAGDRRRIRYGYLQSPAIQKGDMTVVADDWLKNRSSVLGKRTGAKGAKIYPFAEPVWPTEKTAEKGRRLSWIGLSDRYFVVLMHPVFDPVQVTTPEEKLFAGVESVDRLVLNPTANAMDTVIVLRMRAQQHTLAAGASSSHTLGVYSGPRTRPVFNENPLLVSLGVPDMVVYNLGGMCAPCTFGWLTDILISVLRLFESISGDWAVAILILVVLVRSCLHPITRWSQIRMQRFGVQMQSMGPKQKLLKEKYKDDPKKLQAEMGKLWREEGISPTGMLGCLPMFLQSPVWIALYATLFFAVELRHEPAFYGIFQTMTGGGWQFMHDLSMPDGAIPLPSAMHFSFPLWGSVTAINILPLLLGVVFFAHQKYLTPPTQATVTPEQASQQKMMKVMMVVMFPLMMYTAPSGLALYFITNSTIAIVENKWIRAHMNKHGMLDIDNIRASKKDKGPGFLARMSEAAEAQKQLKEKGPRPPNPADRRHGPKK